MRRKTLLVTGAVIGLVVPLALAPPAAAAATMTVGVQLAQLQGDDLEGTNGWPSATNNSGTAVLTGARYEDIGANADQGAAYIYNDTGSGWTKHKLVNPDGAAGDMFGDAVAMSSGGTLAVVAAVHEGAGAVYVYADSSAGWTLQQRLTAGDGEVGDEFGYSVAMSRDGTTILVGSDEHLHASQPDACADDCGGAAYVFRFNGTTWAQEAELLPTSGTWDAVGYAAALDGNGDTAVVGSGGWDTGEAFLFRKTDSTWAEVQRLQNSPASDGFAEGELSAALNTAGTVAAVGDWTTHEVHVFRDTGATWAGYTRDVITSPDAGASDFGYSVSLTESGNTLAAGDYGFAGTGGIAYVYGYGSSAWSLTARLVPSPRAQAGSFGGGLAVSGNGGRFVVGSDGSGVASAFVFALGTADVAPPGPARNAAAALSTATTATVTWDPPTSDGGAQVLRYQVTTTPATSTRFAFAPTDPTASVQLVYQEGDLAPGTSYTFTVVAENIAGTSTPVTTGVVAMPDVPGAPQNVTAAAGDGKARVSWGAPASDGGATLTGYTVTASPALGETPVTVGSGTTSSTISGLTNGTAYIFTVRAENGVGLGAGASAAAVTPEALRASITSTTGTRLGLSVAFTTSGAGTETCALSVTDTKTGTTEATSTSCTSPWVVSSISGGTKTVRLVVTDAFGDSTTATATSKAKGKPLR